MPEETDTKTPVITGEDEDEVVLHPGGQRPAGADETGQVPLPAEAAVLPTRGLVIFPGTVVPLGVGREKSQRLLDAVLPDEKIIVTVAQKDPEVEDPSPGDLYRVGSAVMVLKLLRVEEGGRNLIVHGLSRVRVEEWLGEKPYLRARIAPVEETAGDDKELEALMVNARTLAQRVVELSPNIPDEAAGVLQRIDAPGALADFLAANLQLDIEQRQGLLEEPEAGTRLRRVCEFLQQQLDLLELSSKIHSEVKENIDKTQRQYYLQEQLKAIQKELGQEDERAEELRTLREKLEAARMPDAVGQEVFRELGRLEKLPQVSPEYNVIRTYLELCAELPWSEQTEDVLDINRAREVLDEDHYDLEKVKRRILEYLAVRKLSPESRGPILCFVGPPGVGKTSLGRSIARSLGRKFIRMSLGGIRDEAELRGHRRTYIGAMPGRIIQEIRKAGTNNPVFMLDELDKVGADFRGDPSSALLEILDPAQNNTFQDHYLNVPFDLSRVLFIGTANYMAPVPPALQDRMEVIELPGYTQQQKLQIAKQYLVPRQLSENGLTARQAKWTDEAIERIIASYTREAGVRELERQIGAVCRSVAALIAAGKARSRTINPKRVTEALGPRKYESELALRTSTPGVVTGLAYTPTGGEIIFIESATYPGKGELTLTGQIGDVMKESAQAALSLAKSRAEQLDLPTERFSDHDIHVHVPAGAVPKDGPSAGVAIFTSLISLLTNRPARSDVAMTGEVTLRGLVLPVGGIKEKVLAAKRAGIKHVVLPDRNRKDLPDVPAEAREALEFSFVKDVDEVLEIAVQPASKGKKRRKRAAAAT